MIYFIITLKPSLLGLMVKCRLALEASHVYSEKSSVNNLTKRLIILQWNGSVITMWLKNIMVIRFNFN